jgi:menaquinone-9 beta-reductase
MNAPACTTAAGAASLTADQAASAVWQVIVVGAGPAGASAARRLAARGLRVLLVDRGTMPRWKVCGCCLSVAAVAELRLLGVQTAPPPALPLGALPLETVRLAHAGRSVLLPLPGGGVLSRESLDTAVVAHAMAAGCHWLPHALVTAIDASGTAGGSPVVTVTLRTVDDAAGPRVLTADYVLLAAGLSARVRIDRRGAAPAPRDASAASGQAVAGSRIGLGATLLADAVALPRGELVMAVGREGYCGLVRLHDGRIDLAAAVDRQALARHASPARLILSILADAGLGPAAGGLSAASLAASTFRATPPLTHREPLVAGTTGRILRIGDAAGYVEPFTGEGIGWALACGRIAAEALMHEDGTAENALRPPADAAARYRAAHRRQFTTLHARCRRVSLALRRPAVVMAAMHAARLAPWAARRLVPALVGATAPGDSAP